ncbi:telomerase inhibitor [Xylographa bjoerkii]|nr:telomerase inhibitor [Xylographa bjoerkii]
MLLSQGWTPGTYLGAVDAPHAHLHSNANASHIRVAVKDDNLGLGAKRGSGVNVGECVGLDVFQGLLGRLNGKSEDVLEKEQKSRDDLKRAVYTERRWGALRFVSGGVLVGDKIEKLVEAEKLRLVGNVAQSRSPKPSSKLRNETMAVEDVQPSLPLNLNSSEGIPHKNIDDITVSSVKAKKKAEKAQLKLDRRKRKEERRAARAAQAPVTLSTSTTLVLSEEVGICSQPDNGEIRSGSVPTGVTALGGRHAVRNRYIMHKKMAMMNPKALNEILMIKS